VAQLTIIWHGPSFGPSNTLAAATGLQYQASFAQTIEEIRSKLANPRVACICSTDPEPATARAIIQLARQAARPLAVGFYCTQADAGKASCFIKLGADFCISEPLAPARVEGIITSALQTVALSPMDPVEDDSGLLIGDSRPMQDVRRLIHAVAKRNSTVLVTGETGTGKDLAARAVHAASDRSGRNLVSVNCAAIPEALLEAELFGHTKGAFTGAVSNRVGRFEEAHRSSLFLDEIGEMPLETQAKLLRVLQERELQRLGSSESIKVDVRMIAASNVDLAKASVQKKFRLDLLYRLRVVELRLPPLRERMEDLPQLVDHFIEKLCKRESIGPKHLDRSSMELLAQHSWPGNVRELEHSIESAIVVSGDRNWLTPLDFNLFPEPLPSDSSELDLPPGGIDLDQFVARIEASLLGQALRRSLGNKARAAEMLGIPRTTLISKVKSLQLVG
jgi:DNA-binding NtrC family response regulator